jgi:hypothetical protein
VIIRDLQELRELAFRTWVRDMIFLVALPFHLSQEAGRNPAPERASVERLPCEVGPTAHSLAYLQTKKQKTGHTLTLLAEYPA